MMKAFTRPVCNFFAALPRRINRRYPTKFSLGGIIKFQLVLCLSMSGAFAQTKYKIIHIPTPTGSTSAALGLNENGQVVGYSFQGDDYKTFLYVYPSGKIGEIGSLGGKLKAACAINASGAIAGYCQDGNENLQAFAYTDNGGMVSLGTFEGGATSEAFGINDTNDIAGDSATGSVAHRPFLYSGGSLRDLGIGGNTADAFETAYGVSNGGIVVGRYDSGNGVFHAFQYTKQGRLKDLGTLGGSNSEALAISKRTSSLIAGDSDTGNGPTHACVWSNGNPSDLGALSGFDKGSYARAVNNSGHVVGDSDSDDQKRAFLYENNSLYELDQLAVNLDEAGFTSLDIAYGINDKEWICGCGTTKDGQTHAFLAIPVEGSAQQPVVRGAVQTAESSSCDCIDVFYDQLSSQGDWCDCGNYGHVFRPRVPHGWRPYCNGHWVWTNCGWYWDSDESFGWACFHYGRWIHEEDCWCWVPGHEWAPAWVSWRTGPEHCGWAPLPPEAGFGPGTGIGGWCDHAYGLGPGAYFFIAMSHFTAPNYNNYILPPAQNVTIINNTVNVTNITYNKNIINNFGPSVATIQQKTGAVIKPVSLVYQNGKTPGSSISNGQLQVTGPGTKLNPTATKLPVATIKNPNPVVDKGWKGVDPKTATELQTKIAKENPTPSNLPKPTVTPGVTLLKGGVLPTATPKPSATVFGAATPPGGIKASPTGSAPKGTPTPLKGNIRGGFNPANPGGVIKSPSASPKPTGKPGGAVTPGTSPSASPKATGRPGGAVTPGTQQLGSPTPTPTVHGGTPTPAPKPTEHLPTPTPTPKPVEHLATPAPTMHLPTPTPKPEHLATPVPTPHHSATPAPTPHPTVHLATPPPHHATPTPHPHPTSTPKVVRKEGGGGGGGTTQHNQPVYHPSGGNKPSGGGGGNKPSGGGGGGKPSGGGGKPKPTPTPKK
jgi:probable HAF family extracellular repeat protein